METSRDLVLLIAQTVLGAAVLMLGLATVVRGVRAQSLSWPWRLSALLPPAAPIVAWRDGARALPLVWGAAILAYFLVSAVADGPS